MHAPDHQPAQLTLEQIRAHLLEIDPTLRTQTQHPVALAQELVSLENINTTLKRANQLLLSQPRALYQGLAHADLALDSSKKQLARLNLELIKKLQELDDTSQVAGQGRATYLTFTAGIGALEQEVRLNARDYLLSPADQRMVEDCSRGPASRPGMYALTFDYQDLCVEFAGAFVLTRQSSPRVDSLTSDQAVGHVLLFTPSRGLEAFDSLRSLDQALEATLALPAGRAAFNRHLPVRYQSLGVAGIWPLALAPIEHEPLFEHVHKALLDKRRQDIEWALSQANQPQYRAAQLIEQLDNAIQAALPDLSLRLALRARQLLEHNLYNSLPDWYRHANATQRMALTQQLSQYNRARQSLLELLGPAATPQALARHQLVEQLADELDMHDLDPQHLHLRTVRNVPNVGRYTQQRSLVDLALRGLHDGDQQPDSDFLQHTTLTYAGAPLSSRYRDLTPHALVQLLGDLEPRQDFATVQKERLAQPAIKQAVRALFDLRLVALAGIATLQGHLSAADHQLFEQLRTTHPARLQAHTVLLHGAQLTDLWLLTEHDGAGQVKRALLCTPQAPRAQQFIAFDSLRACQTHIIAWADDNRRLNGRSMSDYLLEQVPLRFRPSMLVFLQALGLKPSTQEHLEVTFGPAASHADSLEALTAHWLASQQDNDEYGAPAWLRGATKAERTRLRSLAQDASGALEHYNSWPDSEAHLLPFDAYLHKNAQLSLNQLLGREQNDIDPDQVFAHSPPSLLGPASQVLSYTQLYRDGYTDGVGFLDEKFSRAATFSGPDGVDLSRLNAQNVARSVTGVWIGQRYTDEIRKRWQDADSLGYGARRDAVLAIQQLQMRSAALESRLKGHIASADLAWLERAIDSLADSANATRQTYKVHRLLIDGDWVIGNYLFSHADAPILLYTPNAPDGIGFREARLFNYLLKKIEGMPAYFCRRVPVQSLGRITAFLETARSELPNDINRTSPSPARHDPIERVPALTELRQAFYNMTLQRKIDDVHATTVNRTQMISAIAWSCVEWFTAVATIPFPALSLSLGGVLAFKDIMLALNAYHQGDTGNALQHYIGYLANLGGAVLFDFRPALRGPLLALASTRPVIRIARPALERTALKQLDALPTDGMQPVLFEGRALWAAQNPDALGRYLLYRHDPGSDQLHSTARLVKQHADGQWVRAGVAGGGRKRYEQLIEANDNPLAIYEVPPGLENDFRSLLNPDSSTSHLDWGLDIAGAAQNVAYTQLNPLRSIYAQRVAKLSEDAQRFFQPPQAPLPKRELPLIAPQTPHFELLKQLFLHNKRLIIGASGNAASSKKLLILNLPDLATQGLKRLYIEHLPRDVFYRELKILNNELAGNQAKALQRILDHLAQVDRAQGLPIDTPFSYYALALEAHAQNVALDGLDTSASYHMDHVLALADGPRFVPRASKLRNFYSHTLIQHNATKKPGEGWLALVDQNRLGTYEHIAGLADLQDAIALRIEDVAPTQALGIWPDTHASTLSRGDYTLTLQAGDAAPPRPGPSRAVQVSDPSSHYNQFDIPSAYKKDVQQLSTEYRGLDTHYWPGDESPRREAFTLFATLRQQLHDAAHGFFAAYAPTPRASLASLGAARNEKSFIERLYQQKTGLVIGEAHSAQSSKQFLIKHFKHLKKQGVKTLYVEHLFTDLHQADLDTFHTAFSLPQNLEVYLQRLDRGQMPRYLGPDTYTNLIKAANKYGLRVRALDCCASYYLKGLNDGRNVMFSYFANEVIKADQRAVGPHKWVALMGRAHTDMHQLTPGIAQLQDAVSLHVRDVPPHLARPLQAGAWETLDEPGGLALRCDFKLQVGITGIAPHPAAPLPDRTRLKAVGQFLIEQPSATQAQLVHVSRSEQILVTPIQIDEKGQYFIDRWEGLKHQRFLYLSQLIQALQSHPPQGLGPGLSPVA